ncbi:hypothetical protein [Natronomonas sp.]|uniref:hypothetical protein n=1 Tax=Natronomonas sp. TaxID=2184060 RepID=UPI002FC338F9
MAEEGSEAPNDGTEPVDALALTREETRRTFEQQVQRLQEIDAKAIEILKANLLLIGILVTAGSILVQTEFDVAAFYNVFTGFGALLLFVSTAIAGVTYNASNLRGGLDTNDIERALERHDADSDEEFEARLLRSYGRWIEHNARVTAVNDILVTLTVLLVVDALAYVVVGAAVGTAGLSFPSQLVVFVVVTVPTVLVTRRVYHMDHLGYPAEDVEVDTFSGVRLSKGATRDEGFEALRRMLAGPGAPSESAREDADE